MARADRTFTVFVMIVVAGFVAVGAFHYDYDWTVLRFPFVVAIVICLLCLGNLAKRPHRPATASGNDHGPPPGRQTMAAVLWVMAVVPMVFTAGFVIGLPLYVLAYLRTHEQSWGLSAALSLGSLAVTYLIFVKLLGVGVLVPSLGL